MRTGVGRTGMLGVTGLTAALACGSPLAVSVVSVGVAGTPVVSPMEQGAFAVTAVNTGDERVVWGLGSSSCQLGLMVLDAFGRRHDIGGFRACTDDLVEQGLDPGGSRTETFLWGGTILVDGTPQTLPNGQYRVFGVAGDRARSERLLVSVMVP